MFCKYCGSHIAEDSIFCSKCGKKLGPRESPRLAKIVQTFRLKTPYPYFALLLFAFIIWAAGPRQSRADYSQVKWSIEQDRKMDLRAENLFQQSFSLVAENTGAIAIEDIPVELSAKIEPQKTADVVASFEARKLLIMQHGRPLPLVVVLADKIEPHSKKRYFLEGSIQASPPFKLTYEVREEGQKAVLTQYVIEK